MITLYQRTDCPFCWKVRLALAELAVEYELVEVQLGEKNPEVLRLSPTGTVPVMVDGDIVIWESGIILDYLDAQYKPGFLIPENVDQQMAVRSVHAYSDKCVGPALRDLVFEKRSKPAADWNSQLIRASEAKWLECQAYLESQLINQSFSLNEFNAADCALAARCGVAEAYGVPVSDDHPLLRSRYSAAKSRHSWNIAYPEKFLSTQ